jgi:Protein of unknown function (DUF3300)
MQNSVAARGANGGRKYRAAAQQEKQVIGQISSWFRRALLGLMLLPLAAAAQTSDKPFSNEQLDQMLAQIALYPDSLLSQVLMAATYPEDFAKAVAWSKAHPDAKGDSAVKMVENEPWDPSVASMVAFPEALITLGDKPDYVRNLGDAFLAQPEDVMDSVQRLRAAAQKAGNLSSNEQVKVSTQAAPAPSTTTVVVQQAAPPPQVIVIEPAQPQVVYVPAYNPTLVYGPWWYPSYPPYYYPPPPGYWFSRTVATGIAWGVGIGISNALWGGFDWGRRDVDINVNRYNNINVNRKIDVNSNRVNWNHDPKQRGNTPYRGGDATRQKLEKQRDAGNREAYRGKDLSRDANRDASRENAAKDLQDRGGGGKEPSRDKAAQALQDRGGKQPSRDASREKAAQAMQDRSGGKASAQARDAGAGRDAVAQKAAGADRDAARQKAAAADRDAARQRAQQASKDNAFKGVNDRDAARQIDRGAASQKAAAARPSAAAAKAPASRPAPRPAPSKAAMPHGGNKAGRGR